MPRKARWYAGFKKVEHHHKPYRCANQTCQTRRVGGGKWIEAGEPAFVSESDGVVHARCCSQDCVDEFELSLFTALAEEREYRKVHGGPYGKRPR